jgi:hypothetical protein
MGWVQNLGQVAGDEPIQQHSGISPKSISNMSILSQIPNVADIDDKACIDRNAIARVVLRATYSEILHVCFQARANVT